MSEFDLIQRYFRRASPHADLGVGDDAALFRVQAEHQLAVSTDMLVAGRHFFAEVEPYTLGWKSLAVNLSDMAAMGAQPKFATLALALPDINHGWLAEFSRGLFACADTYKTEIIGGDTTCGPLNISITIFGEVPIGQALRRDGAQIGDEIWLSGKLGSAAAGLQHVLDNLHLPEDLQATCLNALQQPTPRVALGLQLRQIATSALDISDGLIGDLMHILKASQCDAQIDLARIPCLPWLQTQLDSAEIQQIILAGGDDYELCFTAPQSQHGNILQIAEHLQTPLSCIGQIMPPNKPGAPHLTVLKDHKPLTITAKSYDHFAT